VQDLHEDLAPLVVDGLGHDLVGPRFPRGGQLGGEGIAPTCVVWRDAPCDNETNTSSGALCVEGRHLLQTVEEARLLEAGVHGAHDGPVAKRGESEVERLEEPRVVGHGSAPRPVG